MSHGTAQRKVLVTAGRFMPTTGLVHALKRAGARIDVIDSIGIAPALHVRGVMAHITHAPLPDPAAFADEVAAIATEREIDTIFAPFEDSFFLSRHRDRLPVPLFAPEFETVKRLHNKANFVEVCRELDLPIPRTVIAKSKDELREAIGTFDEFFARPSFSRAGVNAVTNHGAHAHDWSIDHCEPTESVPYLVQSFVDGRDACICAIARDGEIQLLVAYEPSVAGTGGFSIRFTTIDAPEALSIASAVCKHFNYTGLIGFDYRRTADGPVLLECNPRTTAGVFLVDEELFGRALLDGLDDQVIVTAGRSRQYDSYLADRRTTDLPMPQLVRTLFSAPDALVSQLDILPFIYSFVQRSTMSREAHRQHVAVTEVAFKDTTWNGEPL